MYSPYDVEKFQKIMKFAKEKFGKYPNGECRKAIYNILMTNNGYVRSANVHYTEGDRLGALVRFGLAHRTGLVLDPIYTFTDEVWAVIRPDLVEK